MRRCNSVLPTVVLFAALGCAPGASAQMQPASPAPAPTQQLPQSAQPSAPATQSLTLQEAEKIAIQNHPQIQAASYLANVAKAQVTEARSDYYPHAHGSVTGVKAETNSRIAAGALNNPIIYDRFADGVTVEQLVTDFGRTHELGEKLGTARQGAGGKRHHDARGRPAGGGRRLLWRSEGAGCAASSRRDREGPPARFRSNYGARKK